MLTAWQASQRGACCRLQALARSGSGGWRPFVSLGVGLVGNVAHGPQDRRRPPRVALLPHAPHPAPGARSRPLSHPPAINHPRPPYHAHCLFTVLRPQTAHHALSHGSLRASCAVGRRAHGLDAPSQRTTRPRNSLS